MLTRASPKDVDQCEKVFLPPKCRQVTIFVDAATESKPTTASRGPGGQSNVEVGTLYLDHLGAYSQFLRRIGVLSTSYVMIPRLDRGASC